MPGDISQKPGPGAHSVKQVTELQHRLELILEIYWIGYNSCLMWMNNLLQINMINWLSLSFWKIDVLNFLVNIN